MERGRSSTWAASCCSITTTSLLRLPPDCFVQPLLRHLPHSSLDPSGYGQLPPQFFIMPSTLTGQCIPTAYSHTSLHCHIILGLNWSTVFLFTVIKTHTQQKRQRSKLWHENPHRFNPSVLGKIWLGLCLKCLYLKHISILVIALAYSAAFKL